MYTGDVTHLYNHHSYLSYFFLYSFDLLFVLFCSTNFYKKILKLPTYLYFFCDNRK